MQNLQWRQRRLITILMTTFLAIQLLLWLVTPYKPFFAGLFLGGLVSFYNLLYLARRLRIMELHAKTGAKRRAGSGMVNRFLMAAAPILFAVKYPDVIHYLGVIAGLPAATLAALAAELWDLKHNTASNGKG